MTACKYTAPNGAKSELYDSLYQEYGHEVAFNTFMLANSSDLINGFDFIEKDKNGEPTVKWVKDNSLLVTNSLPVKKNYTTQFTKLRSVFLDSGIDVIHREDTSLEVSGEIINENGQLVITTNPNLIQDDTIIHEFGHILVETLGYDNDLIKNAINELRGSGLWFKIKRLYPHLSNERLEKEVLTTAIGIKAGKLFNDQNKASKWRFLVNSFFRRIGEILGIERSSVDILATKLIRGDVGTKIDNLSSLHEQHRRDVLYANEVIDRRKEILEKSLDVITAKIEIYFKGKKPSDRLADKTYGAFMDTQEQLKEDLANFEVEQGKLGLLNFVGNTFTQVLALENKIASIKNAFFVTQETISPEDLRRVKDYTSSFQVIKEIQATLNQDAEFKQDLIDAGIYEPFMKLAGRIDSILEETDYVTKRYLAETLAKLGRGRIEFLRRRELGIEYETANKAKIGTMVTIEGKDVKYSRDMLDYDKKKYINDKIDVERDEIYDKEAQRYVKILTTGVRDISWFTQWLLDGDSANDDVIQGAMAIIDAAELKTVHALEKEHEVITELYHRVKAERKSSNMEVLYDELLEHEVELDEHGNILITGKRSKHFTTEYYSKFKTMYDELKSTYYNALNNEDSTDEEIQDAYNAFVKFERENTLVPYTQAYYDVLDSLDIKARRAVEGLKKRRREIIAKYREVNQETGLQNNVYDASQISVKDKELIDKIDNELFQMKSSYNQDGTKKTTDELYIAGALSSYDTRISALFESGTFDELSFEVARETARQLGKEAEFMRANTKVDFIPKFWEDFKTAMETLSSNPINKEINALIRPFKKADGSIDYTKIPNNVLQQIKALEEKKQALIDEDEVSMFRGSTGLSGNQAIDWIKTHVRFETTPYFTKLAADKIAKRDADIKKTTDVDEINAINAAYTEWYNTNHYYDKYEGKNKPISAWTVINTPTASYKGQVLNKNWSITKVKSQYSTDVDSSKWGHPIDKWKNPQWGQLQALEAAGSALWDMYSHVTDKIMLEDDEKLPYWARLSKGYRNLHFIKIPSLYKEGAERLGTDGIFKSSKDKVTGVFKRSKAEQYGQHGDENENINERLDKVSANERGDTRYRVPVLFRGDSIKYEDQSFDVPTLFMMNTFMSNNYANKREIQSDIELLLDMVGDRRILDTTSTFGKGQKTKVVERDGKLVSNTLSGKDTKIYQMFQSIVEDRIYGVASKSNKTMDAIGSKLTTYTSYLFLGFNYLSATSNYLAGMTSLKIQSIGGEYFTDKDYQKGRRIYTKDMMSVVGDVGRMRIQSKTNLLLEYFGIHQNNRGLNRRFSSDSFVKEYVNMGSAQFLQGAGEHAIVGSLMYSVLENIKVMDENGKYLTVNGTTENSKEALSLNDVITIEDGKIVIDPRAKKMTESNLPVTMESILVVGRKIADIRAYGQGQYAGNKRNQAQRYVVGRLIQSMRKWLWRSIGNKWRGVDSAFVRNRDLQDEDMFYSRALGSYQSGDYVNLVRFINEMRIQLIEHKFAIGNMRSITRSALEEFDKSQLAGIQRSVFTIGLVVVLALISKSLKHLGDDEPKDSAKRWSAHMAALLAIKLQKELLTMVNPLESWKTVNSVSATKDVIDRAVAALEQLSEPTAKYKSGPHKGRNKALRKIGRVFPLTNVFERGRATDALKWYYGDRNKRPQ